MEKKVSKLAVVSAMAVLPMFSFAGGSIMSSLEGQGAKVLVLDDDSLATIKGARLISGLPLPSVTVGINRHFVSWKKFGSRGDYRSYRYLGNTYDSSNRFEHKEGVTKVQRIAGDEWYADLSGKGNNLFMTSKARVEYHYQILDRDTGRPREVGFRESSWNRPISTFRW